MATPHVSGVAALAASRSSSLRADPFKLRSRLLTTGKPLTSLSGTTATGRMVNAWRAVDASPPIVAAPYRFAVPAGAIVGSSSVAMHVSWPAATDASSSVASYALRKKAGSSWSTVTSSTTATSASTSVGYGTATTFRLTATDGPGNTSAGVDSPAVTTTLHGDASSLATYGSGWSTVASSSALGGRLHTARATGATMTFRFTGRSVAIVAPRSSSRGTFKVYVDGTLVTTVDLERPSIQARRAVFSRSWTTTAAHTVKVVAVSSRRIDIDAFVVAR